jgi:hypothetical protein
MGETRVTRPTPVQRYNGHARARPELLIPQNDEHVWVTCVAFVHTAETIRAGMRGEKQVNMDMENIASISHGCFVCEEEWNERLSYRKCPGEPTE